MAALVTIHNDGPDDAMVRIGSRWLKLAAGESTRTSTSAAVDVQPQPKVDPHLLAIDMGTTTPGEAPKPPCRLSDD